MGMDVEKAIVTIKWDNSSTTKDVELPVDIEAKRLSELLSAALASHGDRHEALRYEIFVKDLGRALGPHETLADADIWDGAILILKPTGMSKNTTSVSSPSALQVSASSSPVSRWQALDIELPENAEDSPEEQEKPKEGYVWKQVD